MGTRIHVREYSARLPNDQQIQRKIHFKAQVTLSVNKFVGSATSIMNHLYSFQAVKVLYDINGPMQDIDRMTKSPKTRGSSAALFESSVESD